MDSPSSLPLDGSLHMGPLQPYQAGRLWHYRKVEIMTDSLLLRSITFRISRVFHAHIVHQNTQFSIRSSRVHQKIAHMMNQFQTVYRSPIPFSQKLVEEARAKRTGPSEPWGLAIGERRSSL